MIRLNVILEALDFLDSSHVYPEYGVLYNA